MFSFVLGKRYLLIWLHSLAMQHSRPLVVSCCMSNALPFTYAWLMHSTWLLFRLFLFQKNVFCVNQFKAQHLTLISVLIKYCFNCSFGISDFLQHERGKHSEAERVLWTISLHNVHQSAQGDSCKLHHITVTRTKAKESIRLWLLR